MHQFHTHPMKGTGDILNIFNDKPKHLQWLKPIIYFTIVWGKMRIVLRN